MKKITILITLMALYTLLAANGGGCGSIIKKLKDPSGAACQASGSGFTRVNSCQESCIDWHITCPSGKKFIPYQCTGIVCGDGATCQDDEECIQIDSFADNSRCLKKTICED